MLNLILSSIIGTTALYKNFFVESQIPNKKAVDVEVIVAQAQAPPPVRQLGFVIEFDDCIRVADEQVECSFFIQNGRDSRRSLDFSDSNLFDSEGKSTGYSNRYFSGQGIRVEMPSGVPVKAVATFSGIPRNVGLVFIEAKFFSRSDGESFVAEFRL